MDPYSNLYKRIKKEYLNQKIYKSIYREFCDFIEQLFSIKVLDCDLTRLSHNNKLRLEIIILNDYEIDKLTIENSSVNIRKIKQIREEYKNFNTRIKDRSNYYNELNVQESELEDLFIVVSSFTDNLRWDLNINLNKTLEASFFDAYFGEDQYSIYKEFEVILITLKGSKKKEDYSDRVLDEISIQYSAMIDKLSPVKGIFNNHKIHCFFENEKEYLETYGNFKNYLN